MRWLVCTLYSGHWRLISGTHWFLHASDGHCTARQPVEILPGLLTSKAKAAHFCSHSGTRCLRWLRQLSTLSRRACACST